MGSSSPFGSCAVAPSLFAAEPAFASSAPFRVLTLSSKAEKASHSGENQPEEVRGKHTLSACRLRAGAKSEGGGSGSLRSPDHAVRKGLHPKHVETPVLKSEFRGYSTSCSRVGQKTKVDMLRREVLSAKEVLKATEDKLQYEVAVLQLECAHADTFKESDGDYHKPRYYAVCRDCLKCLD